MKRDLESCFGTMFPRTHGTNRDFCKTSKKLFHSKGPSINYVVSVGVGGGGFKNSRFYTVKRRLRGGEGGDQTSTILILRRAGPNTLSQPKNLIAYSASSKTFVLVEKPILLNANHLFGLAQNVCDGQSNNVNKFLVWPKKF